MTAGPARRIGDRAEDAALAWLQARGLRLVERNWRCRLGEIDLVMRDGDQWVFVEVRYRSSGSFGGALQSVSSAKARRLVRTAQAYLRAHLQREPAWRLDLLAWEGGAPIWARNFLCA